MKYKFIFLDTETTGNETEKDRLAQLSFEVDGKMAYDLGNYVLTGNSGPIDEGKYIMVWKQETDGAWKYYYDIWNNNKA